LSEFPDESFQQILSSSVIGYILPKQAEFHLSECWRLLKPNGRLICTRIKFARGLYKPERLEESSLGSFVYSYKRKGLLEIISKTCNNYRILKYCGIGFFPPRISAKFGQKLYSYKVIQNMDYLFLKLLPFWACHHFIVLEKQKNE